MCCVCVCVRASACICEAPQLGASRVLTTTLTLGLCWAQATHPGVVVSRPRGHRLRVTPLEEHGERGLGPRDTLATSDCQDWGGSWGQGPDAAQHGSRGRPEAPLG